MSPPGAERLATTLLAAKETQGAAVYPQEWRHFDYKACAYMASARRRSSGSPFGFT